MKAENPCSHWYDVENGSKIAIVFIDISGNSARACIRNWLTDISLDFKSMFDHF